MKGKRDKYYERLPIKFCIFRYLHCFTTSFTFGVDVFIRCLKADEVVKKRGKNTLALASKLFILNIVCLFAIVLHIPTF